MKRRAFIKNAALASAAFYTLPVLGKTIGKGTVGPTLKEHFTLRGFKHELEEAPSMVSTGQDDLRLFSLRRMSHPEHRELITSFRYKGGEWVEGAPVTPEAGQYEAPVSACTPGGRPVVAWTAVEGDAWNIHVAQETANGFSKAHRFDLKSGRSINPVLISPSPDRHWLAWENLDEGVFSIYISKYSNGYWSEPIQVSKKGSSCFSPALAEGPDGDLYLSYVYTDGFHQNIELAIAKGGNTKLMKRVPVAKGGGHKDRVNINANPAMAVDKDGRLWISYENNKNASRLDDGDNYTGDRCCALVSYQDGKILEVAGRSKWIFEGENDHKPTFVQNADGELFLFSHCGGTFKYGAWRYRMSWLDPKGGWQEPQIIITTKIKGLMSTPAAAFDAKGDFWFASLNEDFFKGGEGKVAGDVRRARLSELQLSHFKAPELNEGAGKLRFVETQINGHLPGEDDIGTISGHPWMERRKKRIDGVEHTLIYGNMHEHTNSSDCWPAGTDGTLHDDYRFGMYSEGYDFFGMTDHAGTMSEIHWRKNLRMADFYNQSERFVAIPAIEWALQSDPKLDHIQHGAGHYNIIFASTEEAEKFIRNKEECYGPRTPETNNAPKLWSLLREKDVDCVTIPHHPADEVHPMDWDVNDQRFVHNVEIFQCRGNHEYRGAPREINLARHNSTVHDKAFVDYALKEKGYKMSFTAAGDHNSMGVGVTGLWVKEVSRKGIMEALRERRTFATTGDKMYIDLEVNGAPMGDETRVKDGPVLSMKVKGQYALENVEVLRDSVVIKSFTVDGSTLAFENTFEDKDFGEDAYYYIRATQKNKALAWSSPIWVKKA